MGINDSIKNLYQALDKGQGKKKVKNAIKQHLQSEEQKICDDKLQSLQVQSKFSEVVKLELSTKLRLGIYIMVVLRPIFGTRYVY